MAGEDRRGALGFDFQPLLRYEKWRMPKTLRFFSGIFSLDAETPWRLDDWNGGRIAHGWFLQGTKFKKEGDRDEAM